MTLWRTRSSETVYENAWIRVRQDQVDRPDGAAGIYGVVEVRQPAVFVVPMTDDDEIVLIEVDRYTTGRSLEVPAGGSDGEEPLTAARRELREETGLVADRWEPIGTMFALNGIAEAPEHVFLARGLRVADDGAGRTEEGITDVRPIPWPQVLGLVADGTITDGETVAALLYAAIALGRVTGAPGPVLSPRDRGTVRRCGTRRRRTVPFPFVHSCPLRSPRSTSRCSTCGRSISPRDSTR